MLGCMQTHHFMDEPSFQTGVPEMDPVRVVIAYNDLAAGKRAMHVMANLGEGLGSDIAFRPIPWSFELLADPDWGAAAARDAASVDILILATSDTQPLPAAVARWVEAAIGRMRGTAAAVIALFGPTENPDGPDSRRLQAIQAAALGAGLDFFAPSPRHEPDETIARIHRRAELVTPLLDGILHQRPAVSHRSSTPDMD
jgi:hypothetical protein